LPLASQESTFPICDIEHDLGLVVKGIFDLGPQANGKLFPVVSEFIEVRIQLTSLICSVNELLLTSRKVIRSMKLLTVVTGRKARFDPIPREAYLSAISPYLGDFVALDLWEMFNAFADVGFAAAGEPENVQNTKDVSNPSQMFVNF
jgi:hypothetical protein